MNQHKIATQMWSFIYYYYFLRFPPLSCSRTPCLLGVPCRDLLNVLTEMPVPHPVPHHALDKHFTKCKDLSVWACKYHVSLSISPSSISAVSLLSFSGTHKWISLREDVIGLPSWRSSSAATGEEHKEPTLSCFLALLTS
jgi:hypothetical protein